MTTLRYELKEDEKVLELQAKIDEAQKNMVQYLATHLPEELQK